MWAAARAVKKRPCSRGRLQPVRRLPQARRPSAAHRRMTRRRIAMTTRPCPSALLPSNCSLSLERAAAHKRYGSPQAWRWHEINAVTCESSKCDFSSFWFAKQNRLRSQRFVTFNKDFVGILFSIPCSSHLPLSLEFWASKTFSI